MEKNNRGKLLYKAAGFTVQGGGHQRNEDRLAVAGHVVEEGTIEVPPRPVIVGCLADGVGGSQSSWVASQFVVEGVADRFPLDRLTPPETARDILTEINEALVQNNLTRTPVADSATTLVLFVAASNGKFLLATAGDSQAWVLRSDLLFRINEAQSLDDTWAASPLVSYMGGTRDALELQVGSTLRELRPGDKVMLCSDGLLKALSEPQVRAVLKNSRSLGEKARFLMTQALAAGPTDDVTTLLIDCEEETQQ